MGKICPKCGRRILYKQTGNDTGNPDLEIEELPNSCVSLKEDPTKDMSYDEKITYYKKHPNKKPSTKKDEFGDWIRKH